MEMTELCRYAVWLYGVVSVVGLFLGWRCPSDEDKRGQPFLSGVNHSFVLFAGFSLVTFGFARSVGDKDLALQSLLLFVAPMLIAFLCYNLGYWANILKKVLNCAPPSIG